MLVYAPACIEHIARKDNEGAVSYHTYGNRPTCDRMSEIGGQMVLANAFGLNQFAAVAKVSEHA